MALTLCVVIGFALGTLTTYILLKHGWKPAAILVIGFCVCVFAVTSRTDVTYQMEGALLVSFGLSRLVVEPWLKTMLGSRDT